MPNPKPKARTQSEFSYTIEHGELAATATIKGMNAPRPFIVDRIEYVNQTGLVEDNANAFRGSARKGATEFAYLFDTDANLVPDSGASLAAATWVEGTLDADSTKRTFATGDDLDLRFVLTGTQTLPPGKAVVHGRWL